MKAPYWSRLFSQGMTGIVAVLLSGYSFAQAQRVDTADKNSTLRYNIREPFALDNVASSPIAFPGVLEWTVDGRRIAVYPSVPGNSLDVEHSHPGLHVAPNQIHVQGPLFGYASTDVTGGIVYTVTGGDPGSGSSRLTEKVDIRNKSGKPVTLGAINGLGWLPDRSAPHNSNAEIPDLSGLTVTGATIAFIQGSGSGATAASLLTDPPFAPLTVYPAAAISGFNSFLVRNVTLAPGATMTILTELNVSNTPPPAQAAPVDFIEGESFSSSRGVTIEGSHLASLDNGDWAGYDQVNFGAGATVFEALVAVDPQFANQRLEIRLDSLTGAKIGEMVMQSTGSFFNFQLQRATLTKPVAGVHKVYLVAAGTYGVGNVDKFRFIPG